MSIVNFCTVKTNQMSIVFLLYFLPSIESQITTLKAIKKVFSVVIALGSDLLF
jgi:hypothetical protein